MTTSAKQATGHMSPSHITVLDLLVAAGRLAEQLRAHGVQPPTHAEFLEPGELYLEWPLAHISVYRDGQYVWGCSDDRGLSGGDGRISAEVAPDLIAALRERATT